MFRWNVWYLSITKLNIIPSFCFAMWRLFLVLTSILISVLTTFRAEVRFIVVFMEYFLCWAKYALFLQSCCKVVAIIYYIAFIFSLSSFCTRVRRNKKCAIPTTICCCVDITAKQGSDIFILYLHCYTFYFTCEVFL